MFQNTKYTSHLPNVLSYSRLISAPILFLLTLFELYYISLIIFSLNMISDVLDGYIARKCDVCSKLGGFLDVIGDFSFIFSCLIALTINGIYPIWILLVVIFIFLQFLLTSRNNEVRYDPIGKYYGSFLMIILVITLIDAQAILLPFILIGFVSFTCLSISTRILFLNISK